MGALKHFIVSFFSALSSWMTAFEKLGKSAENLSTIAEESSGQYADIARIERKQAAALRLKELNISDEEAKKLLA